VKLTVASIGGRARSVHCDALVAEYVKRTSAYVSIAAESYRTSQAFFETANKQRSRLAATLVLLDSKGRQWTSEELARWLERRRDEGQQSIVFAIPRAHDAAA
jgi:23S rRNA (pseudouridine1915-N3)-methyltransferase